MTSYVTTTTHHRRTASLPRFDDGPQMGRNGDDYIFKVNAPHASRSSQMTSRGAADDYWSKKTLTTARSGEIVSGGGGGGGGTTPRRPSERHYLRDNTALPPPSKTSTPNPSRTPEYRYSRPLNKSSSFSAHGNNHHRQGAADDHRSGLALRSPFPRESSGAWAGPGGVGGVGGSVGGRRLVEFDDGGLSSWEESFRKFNFGAGTNTSSASPGKLMATDDWKKEFLYGEDNGMPSKDRPIGGGGGGGRSDLVYSRTTTTRTRGGNQPRNAIGTQRGYVSDSEDSWNWLEEQRAKLETRRHHQQQQQQHASHEKLDLDERMTRQRSEVEGRLLNDLRSPQSTLVKRHQPLAAESSSSSDLLRYRARSMDNVCPVDPDAYEVVSYSRFGPNVQRRTSPGSSSSFQGRTQPRATTTGLSSAPDEPPPAAFGYGRRAYQTLPRDARLPGTMMPPRAPSSGDQKTVQTFKTSETNRSTGSLNRRKSQEDRDEEITLRPIGPGVQPLESSVNSASTLSRIRLQHTPNAELETKSPPSIHLIPPTPVGASTFSHSSSSSSAIFRSNVRPETPAPVGPGTSGQPTTAIATGSGPTRSGGSSGNTLRFRNDDDFDDMVVVEQAIHPSKERSYDGRPGLGPGSGSTDQRLDQTVRRAVPPPAPQMVRTVVVSPERPPFQPDRGGGANGPSPGFAKGGQGVQAGPSAAVAAWQGGRSLALGGGGDQRRMGMNQGEDSEQRHFAIRQTIQDGGVKGVGVKVENDQRHNFSAQQQNLQAPHDQQFQQLLMQQQQQFEQQIFEQQKQLEQQQQQLLEQQQQLQKQLEQHRMLQQQLSRAGQQPAPSSLQQTTQQQWSYEKTEQLQQPRTITTDQQQLQGQQQQQQPGQQLQFEQHTYDLLPQQQLQNQQFRGQQQQQLVQRQQHVDNHNFGHAFDRQAATVDNNNRGFNPLLQNSVAVQNAQTTFRGQGVQGGQGQHVADPSSSTTGQPLYQSVSEAHGGGGGGGGVEPRVTSPQYETPFSVFQSAGDPLSPTGAAGPSVHAAGQRECRFETVMPTYATPERNNHSFSSGSGGKTTSTTTTTVRTYEQATPSNGTGFNAAPGQDLHHHRFHQIQGSGIVLPHPPSTNGPSPGGGPGDVRISPESYWIQNSAAQRSVFEGPVRNDFGATGAAQVYDISGRDPRKNFSGTSSVESSLSPLSVDITRMKWTDVQGQSSPSFLADRSSGGSLSSSRDGALEPSNQMSIKFVKDASHLWYKPQLSREEVISSLKSKAAGSFLVRDSNTYPGSYALAVKVAAVPDNAPAKKFNEDPSEELVRHFLIESTPTGVRLKGYKSESVFGSLAALIYQHSITPLSLPCRLLLPASGNDNSGGILRSVETSPPANQLSLPAFNVLYIVSTGIELLSGPEAVDRAATAALEKASTLRTTVVSLKVAPNGVTITDNNRSLFFRQHFPAELIRYCGLDRRLRCWTHLNQQTGQITKNKIFGIISRRSGLSNECHLFAEMDSNPSSSAGPILNFINQIIPLQDRK